MKTSTCQRFALATAVLAVLTAGMAGTASAVDISNTFPFPRRNAVPFLGANNTNFRIQEFTTPNPVDEATATIYYFDDDENPLGRSFPIADSNGGGGIQIDVNVVAPPSATQAVVIIDAGFGGADDVAGQQFGYMNNVTGNLIPAADEATAVQDALDADSLLPIDSYYNEINILDVRVDNATGTRLVYVTFNADPNLPTAGGPVAAGTFVNVESGLVSQDLIQANSTLGSGTAAEGLPLNVRVFMDDDGTNNANTPLGSEVPFDADPSYAANALPLSDLAGNDSSFVTSFAPLSELDPPVPDIKANGSDGPLVVPPGESVNISIALEWESIPRLAEYWGILFSFDGLSIDGVYPLFGIQGRLVELPETSLFDTPFPPGVYLFLFNVDDSPDGVFQLDAYDYVVVVVN